MKKFFAFAATLLAIVFAGPSLVAQTVPSDNWAATDALGRKLASREEAPIKRDGKTVAIFYWTWHNRRHNPDVPVANISEVLRRYPEAMKDFNHPAWGKNYSFYWEEPLLGYYQTTDRWVLRKHAEMLADAGVDVVFFDCTNDSAIWEESTEALMETWAQAAADGVKVPKISFLLNFSPQPSTREALHKLYKSIYCPGRYSQLWFLWKGKPCIMAYPEALGDDALDREIASFFTFRPGQPDYVDGPSRPDQWGWLEVYPQHGYGPYTAADGTTRYELVTVGVAQNTNPDRQGHCGAFNTKEAYGRNFSVRNGFDPRNEGWLYGWNFSEQWERAFELDPDMVFVTGWNEFIAGKWLPETGWNGEPFSFVDEYDWNCSRDIEPNAGWGDRGDVYYLQLADYVRRFKGVSPPPEVSPEKTIRLSKVSDWDDVMPYYTSYKGNTFHRDADGAGPMHYVDSSGRNDIVGAKVARDGEYVYFYVECASRITTPGGSHWMQLFIDTDRDKATGWNGYDFVLNRIGPRGGKALLEKNVQGIWMWEQVAGCKYKLLGNVLAVGIPRKALGLDGREMDFEFKWNDNMQKEGDVMDFYVSGDTAPGGRFNYVYCPN